MPDTELDSDSFSYDEDGASFSFEESDGIEAEISDKEDFEAVEVKPTEKYRQWTPQKFVETEFLGACNELHSIHMPQVDFDDILVMLHHCNWQQESVINRFFDDRNRLYDDCGLVKDPTMKNNTLDKTRDFSCSICCMDYDEVLVYSLSCDHKFCSYCYQNYINANVAAGKLIRCIDVNCSLVVPHRDVQMLIELNGESTSSSLVDNRLILAAARVFIEIRKSKFRWCPAPDCNYLVEAIDAVSEDEVETFSVDISKVPIAICSKNHEFCYDCKYENHLPCPCWLVKKWIKKCNDDSETANWIEANTHRCPRCTAAIEKNGGCNHMTCTTCKFEFCWICSKEWAIHGSQYYKCNKFDPQVVDAIEKSQKAKRLSLTRYLHYYKRFSVHETSMKGDQKTLDTVNDKMKIYMEQQAGSSKENLSWIDVQFLHDAFRALTNGRKTLKWSYCFMYYLEDTNYAEVFESMQEYLNKVVEDLSRIFEEINHKKNNSRSTELIMAHKAEIINSSVVLGKRQRGLIDCARSGLNAGLLVFSDFSTTTDNTSRASPDR